MTEVGLSVSVGCADEDLWRTLEPGTPSPGAGGWACARTLSEHGLRCGVLMGPVVPFLSDSPAQLEATVRQIAEAGAGARASARSCCTCGRGPGSGSWPGWPSITRTS